MRAAEAQMEHRRGSQEMQEMGREGGSVVRLLPSTQVGLGPPTLSWKKALLVNYLNLSFLSSLSPTMLSRVYRDHPLDSCVIHISQGSTPLSLKLVSGVTLKCCFPACSPKLDSQLWEASSQCRPQDPTADP